MFRMDLQNNVIEGEKPNYAEYKRKADMNYAAAKKENAAKAEAKANETEKALAFSFDNAWTAHSAAR